MTHLPETDRIVVGVDGSAASLAALLWAADEAELRHAELVAVRAWRASREWLAPYAVAAARPSPEQERERARSGLVADVRRTLGPAPRISVRQELVRGAGASALISRAAGARLLVLGGRPDGHSPEVPPGPVASACLRHPPCPVVLVPPVYVPEVSADGGADGRKITQSEPGPAPGLLTRDRSDSPTSGRESACASATGTRGRCTRVSINQCGDLR
ncbi:universal stress protein [Actinomadura sp. RB99]|uniref:universal stress protein n=1 Tax=Actinomadura sp. RB99 TaxID=2691577 RepID=UPI001681D21C|nr:universal stress protein [Actinomadura sp. RB99]